jgi:hypothetical protein
MQTLGPEVQAPVTPTCCLWVAKDHSLWSYTAPGKAELTPKWGRGIVQSHRSHAKIFKDYERILPLQLTCSVTKVLKVKWTHFSMELLPQNNVLLNKMNQLMKINL